MYMVLILYYGILFMLTARRRSSLETPKAAACRKGLWCVDKDVLFSSVEPENSTLALASVSVKMLPVRSDRRRWRVEGGGWRVESGGRRAEISSELHYSAINEFSPPGPGTACCFKVKASFNNRKGCIVL